MVSAQVPAGAPAAALQLFSDKLSLSAGTFQVVPGERVVGPMRRGLKIGVMLGGRQMLALDDRPPVTMEGPTLLVAANSGDHVQQRTGVAGGNLRCALIQIDLDFVEREFGPQVARILGFVGAGGADIWMRPAGAAVRSLALQMAECPVAPPLRRLYLAGKALELAALGLNEIAGEAFARPSRLPSRMRDQVYAVRDLLIASMQSPPSLGELARASGLNPTRLTSAFRVEFGTSVFGYLQQHRLHQARAMIASGEASVAEAAFRVGYTPAHFSSLFHKRFGMPPSALR